MSSLSYCLAAISATIIATSRSSHLSPVFPEEICLLRSHPDLLHSFDEAGTPSTSEFHLTIVTELDRVIKETYDSLRMTEAEILQRRKTLTELAKVLNRNNLTVEAFGSCCNGFGTATSDLDVQVTGNITGSELTNFLVSKEFVWLYTSKRKPLISFKHSPTGLLVDVTVNPMDGNNMGIFMWVLRKYSRLDSRAQVLGVFLKAIVKKLKISETTFGDLGSSMYLTMLIHYLQQTNPPVLPGISKNKNKAENNFVVRNNATVGQLWLGFLKYYVHEFNYEENIICLYHVRCKTRKEKGWYGPDHNMISIEKPTVEEMDTSMTLDQIMSDYILRVFNQLLTIYLEDSYDRLLRRGNVNLDYHPRYGHKKNLLVHTWSSQYKTSCSRSDWAHGSWL